MVAAYEQGPPPSKAGIWLKGAIGAAVKGIPYGIALGALAAVTLFGGIWALSAMGATATASSLASAFGGFLYSGTAVATGGSLNVMPIIVFNTVLTSIGNLLSGGNRAVQAYEQEELHREQNVRLRTLEGKEKALEEAISKEPRSPHVDKIIEKGPRPQASYVQAEETRAAAHLSL